MQQDGKTGDVFDDIVPQTPLTRPIHSQLKWHGSRRNSHYFFRLCREVSGEREKEAGKWGLALAWPGRDGQTPRLSVYKGRLKLQLILHWLYSQLGAAIPAFTSEPQLSRWEERSCVSEVCVLLVSSLTLPPFLFTALSLHFASRINFAVASPDANATSSLLHRNGQIWLLHNTRRIRYVSGNFRRRERFSWELATFLNWFRPDLNSLFLLSLALVNAAAIAAPFSVRGSALTALSHGAWSLFKYNLCLLALWLLLLSAVNRLRVLSALASALHAYWTAFAISAVGRSLGGQLLLLSRHLTLGLASFISYNCLLHWLRRKFWPASLVEPEPWSEWLRFQRPIIVLNPGRPAIYRSSSPVLSPRLRALITELDLCEYTLALHNDFTFLWSLPVWKAQSERRQPACLRCSIVRLLDLRRARTKLSRRACGGCGWDGGLRGEACSICLEAYGSGSEVVGLPCGHDYHRRCVFSWLLSDPHQTCPCCRWPAYKPKLPPVLPSA